MKNNNLKIILTGISVISANLLFSQCPINFPKAIDVCLEGATQAKNICFENSDGNLNLLFGGENLFSFNKNVIDNQGNDINKLVIHGANQPNQTFNTPNIPPTSYRDISYEFASAGSAKIRSFRGDNWDTYLEFLTNLHSATSDVPQVRMHINHDGKVGIGTINPQAMLDVKGGVRMGNIEDTGLNNLNNLVIIGANNRNYPDENATYTPDFSRDISFEFAEAGKAKIRSFRGDNLDTYLQFLTSPKANGSSPITRMQISANGNVGIGTTDPKALLDVNGNVNLSGNFLRLTTPTTSGDAIIQRATEGNLIINSGHPNTNSPESSVYLNYAQDYGGGTGGVKIYDGGTANHVDLKMITTSELPGTFLINPSGGKVVISDNTIPATPGDYRLYVTGGILSQKFKAAVTTSTQWSDYVFDKNYKLKTLEEVEQYILANKHLPNIPSSEEIIKDGGIDLAQMQAKQMEKIEELTLYLIEMKKEIEDLKKQNKELKEKYKNN